MVISLGAHHDFERRCVIVTLLVWFTISITTTFTLLWHYCHCFVVISHNFVCIAICLLMKLFTVVIVKGGQHWWALAFSGSLPLYLYECICTVLFSRQIKFLFLLFFIMWQVSKLILSTVNIVTNVPPFQQFSAKQVSFQHCLFPPSSVFGRCKVVGMVWYTRV